MALEVTGMARSFTFKKGSGMVTLDDPNPSDSPEMVMSYYSNFYPELTTATVDGVGGFVVEEFLEEKVT